MSHPKQRIVLDIIKTDSNFKWLVIDGTREPARAPQFYGHPLFEVRRVSHPPKGIYDAMNEGMNQAESKWIWYINAGDVLHSPLSMESVRNIISEKEEYDAFGFSVRHIDNSNNLWHISNPRLSLLIDSGYVIADINHQGFITSTELLRSFGGFETDLQYAADGNFMDFVALNKQIYLSEICVVDFILGGASGQNMLRTLREIDLYRPYLEGKFSHKKKILFHVLKTKIRLWIIKRGGVLQKAALLTRKLWA
jgi:putative colanic acid biosynthesis glycosyltransferase